jgi:hypothetical protein
MAYVHHVDRAVVLSSRRRLIATAFCVVAGHHLHTFLRQEQKAGDDMSEARLRDVLQALRDFVSPWLGSQPWLGFQPAVDAVQPLLGAAVVRELKEAGASFLNAPLSMSLPWATYALSGAAAVSTLLEAVLKGGADVLALGSSQATLLVLVLQVSHDVAPLIMLALATEVLLLAHLLRRSPLSSGVEVGAILALVQTQAFFVTGHLCEFAGLQYTAGR